MKNKSEILSKGKTVKRMLAFGLAFFLGLSSFDGNVLAYEEDNNQEEMTETEEITEEVVNQASDAVSDSSNEIVIESNEDIEDVLEEKNDIEEVATAVNDEEISFSVESSSSYSVVVSSSSNISSTYTIWFDNNGKSGSGYMGYISCEYGKEYQLPKCTMTTNGYRFKCWNTSADGTGTEYDDEATVKNLTSTNFGKVFQ